MFTDDQLLPISALQHWQYCPRRAALVHIEGLWAENRYTVEGRHLHERAHDPGRGERRPGRHVARGLELRSLRLGLTGKADVVEFYAGLPETESRIVLLEYKRGRPHADRDAPFQVQVCAQALCLEDMLGRSVDEAYLFFGKTRQRVPVVLHPDLRQSTLHAIGELHKLIAAGRTPPARFERKCRRCSLYDLCLPKSLRPRATASRYLSNLVGDSGQPGEHE
mgnify:CR=1 FL=1